MIFYFIVLNVSKIVSEHYRHPRIPSRSLKTMQDNHKGTESRLKWVKSIKLRTDFFAFFVFSKKCFLNEKLIFHFIVLNVSSTKLGHPGHLSSLSRRSKLRKAL